MSPGREPEAPGPAGPDPSRADGTGTPAPYTGPERRACPRQPVAEGTTAFLLTGADQTAWPALVTDVSAEGVGLVVGEAVEPGRLVIVQLCHPAGGDHFQAVARVVSAHGRPTGAYHLGCAFVQPLRPDQLQGLR